MAGCNRMSALGGQSDRRWSALKALLMWCRVADDDHFFAPRSQASIRQVPGSACQQNIALSTTELRPFAAI